jgi:FkbM family methyltransferase
MLDPIKAGIAPYIEHWMYDGAYIGLLEKLEHVPKINIAFELGARDCYDSISLVKYLNCEVHAFEANPDAAEFCANTIKGKSGIVLNPVAVGNYNGVIDFYAVNTDKYKNIGASSVYKFNLDQQIQPPEVMEAGNDIQYKIQVNMITLESYCNEKNVIPDAIFMDIQGAELDALKGLGDKIEQVKVIALETQYHSCYFDAPVFDDIHEFLTGKGFKIGYCQQSGTAEAPPIPDPPREFWFDLLYVKE